MADLAEIKKMLQELRRNQLDIILRLETLEDKVGLGGGASSVPEPILTCVQCGEDYKESKNADGSCKYHSSYLQGAGWEYKYNCCNKTSRNYDAAQLIPGCTKGKHCSEHHCNYTYAAYRTFMIDTMKTSKEIWMEIDVYDYLAVGCKWAEVGLSKENKVYVLCGESRIRYNAIKVLSKEQLDAYTDERTEILKQTGDAGWTIIATVVIVDGTKAIEISVKPASSTVATTKRVTLDLSGTVPAFKSLDILSGGGVAKAGEYTVPDDTTEGLVIDIGEDYSKDRKNDYTAETSDESPLQLKQKDHTKADSSMRSQDGKWNNLFTAVMMVTNGSSEQLAITGVEGYYAIDVDKDEWKQCDECWIGVESYRGYHYLDTPNFNIDSNTTGTLATRLCIKIPGNSPPSGPDSRRADSSLPQPLHLRAVFTDQAGRKASIRFEYGNPPLDIPTRETRTESWAKKSSLYCYCFADDLNKTKRSDAAVYFDDKACLTYRPVLEEMGSNYYDLTNNVAKFAYAAKQAGQSEFEIADYVKKNDNSSIRPFVLVDLENEVAYGFKIAIKTPTSSATSHCLLPPEPDPSTLTLSITPETVKVGAEFTVGWTVPRAATGDRIYVYPQNGKESVKSLYYDNKKQELSGTTTMKAPTIPGKYEARYYPAALTSQSTGNFHNTCWMKAVFTVAT